MATMTASVAENPIDPPASVDANDPHLNRRSHVTLGLVALIWAISAAAAVIDGASDLFVTIFKTIGISGLVVVGAGGATCCLLGAMSFDRRLTLARTAEKEARRKHALLSQILEALPIGVQIKNTDLRYVWFNAEHARRLGVAPSDLIGKTAEEVGIDPALAAAAIAHDRRVLASGQVDGPEEQIIRNPDGKIAHIALVTKVPLIERGKIAHIVTVGADLTPLRAAQLQSEEIRRLLETIIDAAPVTIQITDRKQRLRWANSACRALFGLTAESPIGKRLSEVMPEDLLSETLAANQEVFATGRTQQLEQCYPATADRPEQHMLVTKTPIYDDTGAVTQVLTLATDVTALKQAQATAETANRLIEGILRYVPLSIQVKDSQLRYRWVNHAFANAMHRTPEGLLGKTVDDLDAPAWAKARTHDQDRRVLRDGETLQFEERWVTNGKARHMLVIKAPILDAEQRATHVITIGADVTEQHRLRTEADEARRRLQVVLDNVPVTIALKDANRRYLWINREYERVHGEATAAVIGQRREEISPHQPLALAIAQQDADLLRTGLECPPTHEVHVTTSGEAREFSMRRVAVRDSSDGIEGILAVGVDITEISRATETLRRVNEDLERLVAERTRELASANELMAAVIEGSPIPIVTFRLDGGISSWNPAAERVTGYTAAEAMQGLTADRLPEAAAQFADMRSRILRGESFMNMDARRRRKDGREIDLLISGAPLRRADGSINGAVGTWLDVTEQRAVERQLRHAQRMEAVGQLTGGVAHDFNNLLAIVIGTLDLLLQQLPADGEPQELVNQAIEAAERGAALTRRLLAFARQQTLRPVATGINALIAGMQPLLQRAVGEPIVITLQAQADLWPARVDPGQLEHAILNLAVNARDAMPQGGTLAIATFNTVIEPDNTVDQTDATAGDYVCIRVSDSGTGIPPDTLPRVFEPFFTTKEVGQGSGLGLSMVFGFVKQSGGQVRIDSELGAGTSVTLYLPRAAG